MLPRGVRTSVITFLGGFHVFTFTAMGRGRSHGLVAAWAITTPDVESERLVASKKQVGGSRVWGPAHCWRKETAAVFSLKIVGEHGQSLQ